MSKAWPDELPRLFMPDPDKVDLSPSVQDYYEGPQGLAVSLREHYLSTGEKSPEEPPDLKPPKLHIESGDKQFSGIENYEVKKEKLRMTGVKLLDLYGEVPDRTRRSAEYSKDVRVWTSKFIEDHNAAISKPPPDGVSYDENCMNEITKTIDNLNAIMADAVKGQKKEADEIEKLAQQVEKLTQQSETLTQQVKKLKKQVGDEGDPRPGELDPKDLGVPKEPGMPFDPGIPYDPSPSMDPRLPLDSDPDLTEDPGASPYRSDVDLDPQEAVAGPAAPAATPIGSAMGSRDDQTTGINPWMIPALSNSMQPGVRNEPDPDRLPATTKQSRRRRFQRSPQLLWRRQGANPPLARCRITASRSGRMSRPRRVGCRRGRPRRTGVGIGTTRSRTGPDSGFPPWLLRHWMRLSATRAVPMRKPRTRIRRRSGRTTSRSIRSTRTS